MPCDTTAASMGVAASKGVDENGAERQADLGLARKLSGVYLDQKVGGATTKRRRHIGHQPNKPAICSSQARIPVTARPDDHGLQVTMQ